MRRTRLAVHFLALLAGSVTADEIAPINYARGLGPALEPLCAGIVNSGQCAEAIERHQLAGEPKEVSRDGARLTLRPTAAAAIVLSDGDLMREPAYRYLTHLRGIHAFLLHAQFYEGRHFVLVHDETGARLDLDGTPIPSPDGTRFALAADLVGPRGGVAAAEHRPYQVQVWRSSATGFTQEWASRPYARIDCVEWRGNGELRAWRSDQGGDRLAIVRVGEDWKLREIPAP